MVLPSRAKGQPSKGRRRGAVFSVRVTDDERAQLEALQGKGGGPRRLGPWLLWRALAGRPPPRGGSTRARRGRRGTTSAGEDLVPGQVALPWPATWPGTTAAASGAGTTSPAAPLPRPGTTVSRRVVLDLCAGSGAWSEPYVRAGYDVRRVSLPGDDVRTYVPPPGVWGILAAPPCSEFSLAKNGAPRDLIEGMECVNACMRIILQARPRWWALENPTGLLGHYLGTPRDVWQPCDFGDPWTKQTAIWGDYQIPTRGPFVKPASRWSATRHGARTPPGFAQAFFDANP